MDALRGRGELATEPSNYPEGAACRGNQGEGGEGAATRGEGDNKPSQVARGS